MLNKTFCVEILAKNTKSGAVSEGSGYTIGPNWILTAYHVLFDDEADPRDLHFEIAWPQGPLDEQGAPNRITSDKQTIKLVWSLGGSCDLALLRCELPAPFRDAPGGAELLASALPESDVGRWKSFGYLWKIVSGTKTREDAETGEQKKEYLRDYHDPQGPVGVNHSSGEKTFWHVDVGGLDSAELWQGFSGAPVFVADRLVAIVTDARPGSRGKALHVSLIPPALEKAAGPSNQTLAKLFDIDLDKEYLEGLRSWFCPRFVACIKEATEDLAKEALALSSLLLLCHE